MVFGIDVVVVAPGAVATPIWDKSDVDITPYSNTPYVAALEKMRDLMTAQWPQGPSARADRRGGEDRAHDRQAEGPLHRGAQSGPAFS